MLKWARVKSGLTLGDVAYAESIDVDVLQGWENGDGSPSYAKLKKLAKRYKRPLMVFYLAEPPQNFSVVKDYRTLPSRVSRRLSPELLFAIRTAQERQAWAAEYLRSEDAAKVTILRSATRIKNAETLGRKLRDRLGVTIQQQSECVGDYQAFHLWREACESMGVLVFQSRGVDVKEMRGFALPNPYSPVIVLNSKDAPTARAFTLIHELAHLARGESALTGAGENLFAPTPDQQAESFCNRVSAEALVPKEAFQHRVPTNWELHEDSAISELARHYHVSRAVIVFRLVEAGYADKEFLSRKLRMLSKKKSKASSRPIPQDILAMSRNGRSFARLAMSAYHAGDIHGGELSKLLNLNLKHLAPFEARIFPNRIQPLIDVQPT